MLMVHGYYTANHCLERGGLPIPEVFFTTTLSIKLLQ